MRTPRIVEDVVDRIERAESLDKPAEALTGLIGKVVRPGPVEDTLSGVPAGHPLHPALVAVPIGAWVSAIVLDIAGDDDAARRLTGFGVLAALPAAATGASDWASTMGPERRVGFVHAVANYAALGAYGAGWWARKRGARGLGIGLSVLGGAAVSFSGWLGGHLAYAQGVGVDTTVFQQFPTDWTDAMAESDLPAEGAVSSVDVAGIPVLVARRRSGIVALADRCTHRGAPLHEGQVQDGCIRCPWHDSVFALDDGAVQSGPATRPQPRFEARLRDGRVELRRAETRSLRTNPTGV
jgi:nitrite reductase/ring-hydroxylating ferredoxin subunit/uncharacterized membrane protein